MKFVPVEWFLANLQPNGLWNLAKYLVITTCFQYDLRYWLDFWYVSVYWISFRLNDFGLIYTPWIFNFGQIFSCHHFISLCFEMLTWFLVFGITMMNYRSSLAFVILSLLLGELKKGETFASLLNIHGGDIRVVPTHLFFFSRNWLQIYDKLILTGTYYKFLC